jgi:N-acetylmuramoyl-L-alanine amidase
MFFHKKWKSPNFEDRKPLEDLGQLPFMVILHYTGMESAKGALARLCDPASKVSAHYVIEENGRVHHLVSNDKRAWHAGLSYWRGMTDINSASIGIELVNPGHEFGYKAFPQRQIKALETLLQRLCSGFDIPPSAILGHSDIAPSRKTDPGELFPWEDLAKAGFGLWPAPLEADFQAAQDLILNPPAMREQFTAYGYDPAVPFEIIIEAYHRHYYPEKFKPGHNPKEPDIASIARLLSLIRQSHEV